MKLRETPSQERSDDVVRREHRRFGQRDRRRFSRSSARAFQRRLRTGTSSRSLRRWPVAASGRVRPCSPARARDCPQLQACQTCDSHWEPLCYTEHAKIRRLLRRRAGEEVNQGWRRRWALRPPRRGSPCGGAKQPFPARRQPRRGGESIRYPQLWRAARDGCGSSRRATCTCSRFRVHLAVQSRRTYVDEVGRHT